MDIVQRLKYFIDYLQIPVTQFADKSGIPRPTLSQLLNGRNKTVRDELITKIHEAYPELSVMWLMFGEGDILVPSANRDEPFATAPGQEGAAEAASEKPLTVDEVALPIDFYMGAKEEGAAADASPSAEGDGAEARTISFTASPSPAQEGAPSAQAANGRSIVNIIVYYSDNSFQSFVPEAN